MKPATHNKLFFLLTCLLTGGIFINITTPLLCLIVILVLLFRTSRHTAAFYLIMYGGVLGGAVRFMYPIIPLYGLLLNLLGLFLMRDLIIDMLRSHRKSVLFLGLTLFAFGISYLFAEHTEYANTKIRLIIQNGLFLLCAYYLLDKSKCYKVKDISILLLLTSIFLISFAVQYYNIYPSSVLDFNWFRQGLQNYHYINKEFLIADYQEVGMNATYAMALMYSMKKHPKGVYLYAGLALFITLVSGARQSLLAFIMIIFFRYAFFNESRSFKKVLSLGFSVIFLYVVFTILQTSNIDAVTNTIDSGDSERTLLWLESINIFQNNPITGVGLGGFPLHNPYHSWPHNFFLEILTECGLLGMVVFLILIIVYICTNKISIKHCTNNGIYYFLTLLAIMVKFMVSADFTQSIALFSAIFAISKNKLKYDTI